MLEIYLQNSDSVNNDNDSYQISITLRVLIMHVLNRKHHGKSVAQVLFIIVSFL